MTQTSPTPITAARATRLYSIGQVHIALKDQFADLTLSKLRFLEEQGLVTPVRTASGYRKFADSDIDRLRIILELQRDKYLPLKVIREYLEDLDNGRNPKMPAVSSPAKPDARKRFTLAEMVAQLGISQEAIAEAQEVGIMGAEPFTVTDMMVAGSLTELKKYGITARHLKGTKAAIDRDLGIIEGIIAGVLKKNEATSRSVAADHAANMANHFSSIREALIASVLSKIDS
jgi:DNA-binding transcriptional MerR regulator